MKTIFISISELYKYGTTVKMINLISYFSIIVFVEINSPYYYYYDLASTLLI